MAEQARRVDSPFVGNLQATSAPEPADAVPGVRGGGEVAALSARLAEAEQALAAERVARRESDERAAALLAELEASRDRLDRLRASTSWRLSAPVRWAGRGLRRGMTLLRAAYRSWPAPAGARPRVFEPAIEGDDDGPLRTRKQKAWPASRPLVSVVIPCFNYGRFVPETVASVLAQTWDDIEIVLVDGGSTDAETRQVLEGLRGAKTSVYSRDTRHLVGDNRNFGIARARGKYICCLDSDDLLAPTYLEKALFLLEAQDYDVVSTSIGCFGQDSTVYGVKRYPTLTDMVRANEVTTCALFRRELWERAGGFQDAGLGEQYLYEDWRLWMRFAALGCRIANLVDEPLFRYRVHSRSFSRQHGIRSIADQREPILELNRDLIDEAAFRRSEENRALRVRVAIPLVNLRRRSSRAAGKRTILLAVPCLLVSGAARLLSEIVAHLCQGDYRVVVVSTVPTDPAFSDSSDWFERCTPEIYHLPRFLETSLWRSFVFSLIETKNVAALWIAGSSFFHDLLPEIKAAWPGLPTIDLLSDTAVHASNSRKQRSHIDQSVVESQQAYELLRARGEAPERLRVIAGGVDLDRFRPRAKPADLLDTLSLPSTAFVVGFSGRLVEEQGPEAFLDLAARLRDEPRVHFVMAGAGPLAERLRGRIADLAMASRLQLLGKVDEEHRYLATLDALVLPSDRDARPLVVMASLATGVPVIATRARALEEMVVDGETGFLCPAGDTGCLAAAVRFLAEHPEAHRQMSLAARSFAEVRFDSRLMLAAFDRLFSELLGEVV